MLLSYEINAFYCVYSPFTGFNNGSGTGDRAWYRFRYRYRIVLVVPVLVRNSVRDGS